MTEGMRHLVQSVWRTQEDSFVRHVIFNLWVRHGIIRMPEAVKASILMLRFKRAVERFTPEEREAYELREEDHNIYEGWTTKIDKYSYEYAKRPLPKESWSW